MRRLRRHRRQDVVIAHRFSPDMMPAIDRVDEALDPGGVLFTESRYVRYYPGRTLAAQVLGAVRWDGAGIEGVERHLDEHLRGATYKYVQRRDRRGRSLSSGLASFRGAPAGDSVVLTLDRFIQQAAEDALDAVMEASLPANATVVVIDVETGQVLALANRPTVNLNDPSRDTRLLQNYAVSFPYEPGSVLKPFIAALALEEGLTHPDELIDCEGGRWRIGRTTIKDDHPRDVIPLTEVIKFSSNIGAAKLAFELGAERVIGGLERFGFASRTGVELPNEVSGRLRRPDRIKPIELATTAFGQGMTSTALQLAGAAATLGNDGLRMKPYVVHELRDRRGNPLLRNRPEPVEQAVSPEVARATVAMMKTVLEPRGTGTRARIPGYTAAGKTGTAQKVVDGVYSPTARVATFVGLAPAAAPPLAIAVLVDTPPQGSRYRGIAAGPAFAHIGAQALPYLGVAPDPPEEDESGDAEGDAEGDGAVAAGDAPEDAPIEPPIVDAPPALAWWAGATRDPASRTLQLPDLTGLSLRDALTTLDSGGLKLAVNGSGQVVSQSPPPGAGVLPGDLVEVRLR